MIAVIILACIAFIINWVSVMAPNRTILLANDFAMILFTSSFAVAVLIKTFQPGDITFQRIEGSIIVYLLIGLIFALGFHAIYLFSGASSFNNIERTGVKDFLYYSFITLATVGYGDITPVHPFARSMATFEALIGQLYPAILIARLVSMEFESSKKKKEQSDLKYFKTNKSGQRSFYDRKPAVRGRGATPASAIIFFNWVKRLWLSLLSYR